jgi:hypothetical protein
MLQPSKGLASTWRTLRAVPIQVMGSPGASNPDRFSGPAVPTYRCSPNRIHLDTATIARSIEHGTLCQRSCRPPRMIAPALGNRTVMPLHIGNLVRWIKSRVVCRLADVQGPRPSREDYCR